MTVSGVASTEPDPPGWRRWLPVVALAAGLVAYFALGLNRYLTFETLRTHRGALVDWVAANTLLAGLAYLGVYAALVAFSLPLGSLATLVGGFLFGVIAGTALTVVGATAGAIVVFLAARGALGGLLRGRAGGFLARMEGGFARHAFSYLLFLRLVPVFPFWLVNVAPAFFRVPLRTFALTTFVGIVPGTAVFAGIGSGLGGVFDRGASPDISVLAMPSIWIPLVALSLLSLVPIAHGRWKARRGAS